MDHVPDHTPAAAAVEHAALIAALDAGDLAGRERDRAAGLVDTCAGCASLLADLAIIRAATATLPAPPRRRDYRLTDADAARLRPSAWRSLVGWLGAPRSTVRPLAGGLVALGIAGLLLTTTPGFLGQVATTVSTVAAPVAAPAGAGSLSGAAPGDAGLNAGPSTAAAPAATTSAGPAAVSAPLATSAPVGPATTPNAAARPAPSAIAVEPPPSPLAAALPAPAGPATSPELTGPAPGAAAGASGFATGAGAADSGSKAVPPEATSAQRTAALPPASGPPTPDRTLPLALSLALLVAGVGLLAANRVLRRRARS